MTKAKQKLLLDQNPLKNLLYNTFVLPLMIKQNEMIHDIEVEVHHEIIMTKITIHKTYRSTSRGRFNYDKSTTPPQNTPSRDDSYKRDSRSYRSRYRSYKSP